jgi:UDP-N-acetylglucosamine 4,6-dehydratase/5-epimerase
MNKLQNKTILITGGTGSFGKELLNNLSLDECREVRIFSRDELKQENMRTELAHDNVKFYIGDVRDRDSVDNAMEGVDLVFHAAALKQVPSCEFFPMQAVLTNVIGSNNVIEAARKHKVAKVVCLSTDKAVYPVNAMGITKAMMEKIAHSAARNVVDDTTVISSVRYGNVLYSRGSVIPLFIKQIKNNVPITITESSMTRFLLPLQSAIDLVLFAFENAEQGDTLIKKAPACSVGNLAIALKNLFQSNVPIKNIGMRHGEKIYETLATAEELSKSEDMGDYYRLRMDGRDLNYSKYDTDGDMDIALHNDYTSHNTYQLSIEEVEKILREIPEVSQQLK